MKTVRYCFVTFFLNFLLKIPSFPPPSSLWSHLKAVGTTQSPFSSSFFSCKSGCILYDRGGGEKKQDVWSKASATALLKHLANPPPFPLKFSPSFYKQLSPYWVHPKTVERYCERSTGTTAETAAGKEHKYRIDWSCEETQTCVSLSH